MPMTAILFYLFSAITLASIVAMIFMKNPITAAVCLITSFFSLAGIYALLSAHFVAVMQVLVYAGAIMVLFIFVIMLLNLKDDEFSGETRFGLKHLVSLAAVGAFAAMVVSRLMRLTPDLVSGRKDAFQFPILDENFGRVSGVGRELFGHYVVAFELIGLLLLLGIVGAIFIGRRHD